MDGHDGHDGGDEMQAAIPALGHFPYKPPVSMGTTLIACEYANGVVVGTDSRTSAGSFISSRCTDKITPITSNVVVCRSGSAADTQAVADIVKYHVEVYSLMEREPVSVYRTAQIFRQFLYQYRDQMSASVIVAGWDAASGGQVYTLPLGGFFTRQRFTASGSGSTFVLGYMDKMWRPGMSLDEVKDLVRNAVGLATMRDGSSGGVIRLAVVDGSGTQRELVRPDTQGGKFPTIEEPTPYSHLPPHVAKRQAAAEGNDNGYEMV